jgi:hypothetical protein
MQKTASKLYIYFNIFLLKNLNINDNEKIYIPFFFDFRGRFYYNSPIGPTNLKFSRYFYNYGVYTNNEYNVKEISLIKEIIEKNMNYINEIKKMFNITKNLYYIHESILWILISIGKISIDKAKIEISMTDFLLEGISALKKKHVYNDLIDTIEYSHYVNILKSLNEDKLIKRPILKDATASFIQNLIRVLGYKDENSLKYANLDSEDK